MGLIDGLKGDLRARIDWGINLMAQFQIMNDIDGINPSQRAWLNHRMRQVSVNIYGVDMVQDMVNLAVTGQVQTAYDILSVMTPDDMSQPHHWLSAQRIAWLRSEIGKFLGVE